MESFECEYCDGTGLFGSYHCGRCFGRGKILWIENLIPRDDDLCRGLEIILKDKNESLVVSEGIVFQFLKYLQQINLLVDFHVFTEKENIQIAYRLPKYSEIFMVRI